MNETNPRFARPGLGLAMALLALAPSCASKPPAPPPAPPAAPPPTVSESEWIQRASASCTNAAQDRGLRVIESRNWAKSPSGTWESTLQVRAESGGLAYDMVCRYDPARNKVSLTRP